jgi:hypothetical protein
MASNNLTSVEVSLPIKIASSLQAITSADVNNGKMSILREDTSGLVSAAF